MSHKFMEWFLYHFKDQYTFIYCKCDHELNHKHDKCIELSQGVYQLRCPKCGRNSVWDFNPPVPILKWMQYEDKYSYHYRPNPIYAPSTIRFSTQQKQGDDLNE